MNATLPEAENTLASVPETSLKNKNPIRTFLEMIKFEHTIFALPFAYTGAFLAGKGHLEFLKFFWITVAMASARTAGMSLNRLIDKDLDATNPRTKHWVLPTEKLHPKMVQAAIGISLFMFLISCAALNKLCLFLSPLPILLLVTYSYLKRYTWLCHAALGFILACAPVGGWVAITGRFAITPIALGAAVLFWLLGFDILYACQDCDFDRQFNLFSIPRKFGVEKAFWISAISHVVSFLFFALTGLLAKLGWPYGIGLLFIAGLLIYEHTIVTPKNLNRINQAFFQANAMISVILFLSTMTALGIWP